MEATTTRFRPVTAEFLTRLQAIVGEDHVTTAQAELDLHSRDQSHHQAHTAEVIVRVTESQQVSDILKLANEAHIPVTPWGAGTSLEGNPIPRYGGILLSFEQMNRIIDIHADDFQVTVQAGVPHKDLNEKLARYGLFFPPDPGANATVGGMLANNAAGIRTVKYGASKDNVLQMQVALADGQTIRIGARSIKQSSGYDLLHLLVGSEGTLGIITEATLKLSPVPMFMTAMIASFPTVEAAVETVVAVRGSGVDVAALEFLDVAHTELLNKAGFDFVLQPSLLMEIHATHEATLDADIKLVREICEESGAVHFRATSDHAERKSLWKARHHIFETLQRSYPGQKFFVMDVAVPISAYPQIINFTQQALDAEGIPGYLLGHAGDGNIHIDMPFDNEDTLAIIKGVNGEIVSKALELGGTATGEHGVGMGKVGYMEQEHGAALDVMRAIKTTLDPNGILNPGKVLPAS